MSMHGKGTKWRRNIAKNFNRLNSAQETDDKWTDDDR